ncbi:MAG: hypothetical protein Q9168_006689 [Polycauliona sp. 1 TL-2023]
MDAVDMPSTDVDLSQPATDFAAKRNHPRHLPTPIIPELANISFKHYSANHPFKPRQQPTLPSFGPMVGKHNRASNLDLPSPQPSMDFMINSTQDQLRGRSMTAQISSTEAAEVMPKTFEKTLSTQIHANGFTDEEIQKAGEADMHEAGGAHFANAYAKDFVELAEVQYQVDEDYQMNSYDDQADMMNGYTYGQQPPQHGFLPNGIDATLHPGDGFNPPEPSPKILSPSFLDPRLIPGSMDSVIERYHAKKAELERIQFENERIQFETERMQFENETNMQQCLHKYGQHPGPAHAQAQQEQSVPGYWGPGPQPDQQSLTGLEHLPTYGTLSDIENETHGEIGDNYQNENGATTYSYPVPSDENALVIYQEDRGDEPTELALSPLFNPFDGDLEAALFPQSALQVHTAPPSSEKANAKKRTPKKVCQPQTPVTSPLFPLLLSSTNTHPQKAATSRPATQAKKPSWYASHLENTNLPTSTISSSAYEAGLAWDPKAPKPAKEAKQTKKRRRIGDEVPAPEIQMPAEMLRALFASGLPMVYTGDGLNPFNGGGPLVVKKKKRVTKNGKGIGAGAASNVSGFDDTLSLAIYPRNDFDVSDNDNDEEQDATYGGEAQTATTPKKRGNGAMKLASPPRKAKVARMV